MVSIIPPDPDSKTDPPAESEVSVDLTPGIVWSESQVAVLLELTVRAHRAETALRRVKAMVGEHREGRAPYMRFDWDGQPLIRLDSLRDALGGDA